MGIKVNLPTEIERFVESTGHLARSGLLFLQRIVRAIQDHEERLQPAYAVASLADISPTGTYAAITVTVTDSADGVGTRLVNISYLVAGSTGSAWVQFGVTNDTGGIDDGVVVDVGNSTIQVSDTLILASGVSLELWVRGSNVTLTNGKATAIRFGST